MKNYIYILLMAFLFGCTPKPITSTNVNEKETIEKEIVKRDTIIKVNESNAELILALEALKHAKQPVMYKDGQSTIKLQLIRDTIYAQCKCDSLQIAATLLDTYIKQRIEKETQINTTTFKRLPIAQRLGIFVIIGMVFLLIGGGLYLIIKKIIL